MKWIKKATENSHGQFKAKAEKAGKSTREYAEEHKSDGGKTGKQAALALNLMRSKGNKDTRPTTRGMMRKMHGTKGE